MALSAAARQALREAFGEGLRLDEPLARHTSARIGGPADALIAARSTEELARAARLAWTHDIPLFVLGGGSNVLVSDAGFRGLVVRNRTGGVAFEGETVVAESGVRTITLARRCIGRGLAGMEWAIGVPGTVGGAVFGNAGAHGGDMDSVVRWVEVATPEGVERLSNDDLAFAYRSSALKRRPRPAVILRAALGLAPEDAAAIGARADAYNAHRKQTQPPGATIGSMFKNPPGDYAGRLIDAAGLKGTQIGGAAISEKHANFFVNMGEATAADVKGLIDAAREAVEARFGVRLELEIELVGAWGK
jgi:UDP-N-acetylmuramate dehydrogenase